MAPAIEAKFKRPYDTHLQLKGLRPKTLEVYARAIRRIVARFGGEINDLTEAQRVDGFIQRLKTQSWSAVKLDLYGLKFFYIQELHKPWKQADLIKPPKTQRLPDRVTRDEIQRLLAMTHLLSYRVFFTLYRLGLCSAGACVSKSVIPRPPGNGCLSRMPRATRFAGSPCRYLPAGGAADSGTLLPRSIPIVVPGRQPMEGLA